METRSCYFNGESGVRYDLSESDDLIIIRTREGSADAILSAIPALDSYRKYIFPFDSFPESNVYLYKCGADIKSKNFTDEIKTMIRGSRNPLICYVGTVLKFKGTEIYQIYTGNIFIKFYDHLKQNVINAILSKKNVKVKLLLHIGLNTFFSEPEEEIGRDVFELSQEFVLMPEVEYCHPELIVKTRKVLLDRLGIPEPPLLGASDWILTKTGVYEAWKISRGKGVKICVIDDGLEFDHPAFKGQGKIIGARDMMDKEQKRRPSHQFDERHGTACASIACSADNNALGIAPDAALIPVRVSGLGSILQSEAFYWAVQQEADVISCSWGPPDGNIFSEADNEFMFPIPDHTNLAIRYATSQGRKGKGTPVVFAAGNGKEPVKNDGYASHKDVFAVGASNKSDHPTVYSDYGFPMLCCFPSGDYQILAQNNVKKLDGVKVADRLGPNGYTTEQYYNFFDGTSASCPGVAGVIALMLAANPDLSRGEVGTMIKLASKKIGSPDLYRQGYSQEFGYGLLMADKAVQLARVHKNLNSSFPMATIPPNFALSLHIGINNVDPSYYQGFVPPLAGCLRDMANMRDLAQKLGYKTLALENAQATRKNILEQIESLGKLLAPGGILLITYAGHGAPIPDSDDDEDDKQDESWVTYDGFLIDDEINNCLATIPAGKRVVIVSDSCHSQSVSREVFLTSRVRCISKDIVREILKANNETVAGLRSGIATKAEPGAFVKLLAACQDNQFAKETGGAGVFTTRLREVYDDLLNQQKSTTYFEFIKAINNRMNDNQQIADILNTGATNFDFDNQHPFSISSQGAGGNDLAVVKKDASPKQVVKEEVLIVKSGKKTIRIPVRSASRSSEPAVEEVRIFGSKQDGAGTIDASEIVGNSPWDKAYQVILNNPEKDIAYVQPEIVSNIYFDDALTDADGKRSAAESEFLSTYPNPGSGPEAFNWHLDDRHSQLKRANEAVFPEIKFQDFPKNTGNLVKIAHIDTGFLFSHPSLPINLDPAAATFTDDARLEGATDFDLPLAVAEQQGHGNATMSILAGGKLRDEDTQGEFRGFFGAIPFARVLSLKISETVALLSGKRFAAAVDYAIEQNCDVITMSMAGLPSKVMAEAVNKAYNAGIVIVSAAGNSFVKGIANVLPTTTLYPARYPQTIAAVGTAFDEKPYLFHLHNPGSRSTDSEFMQMNYGPEDALKTTLAAYTPNLVWFNTKEKQDDGRYRYFIRSGGGTSCATPQIAAAAALYIQMHRAELNRIAGDEKWKIVEMVKTALFEAAANNNPAFGKYYGNGVLRAFDALAKKPSDLEEKIQRAEDADGGGNIFKKLFRIFSGRSAFGTLAGDMNTRLQEMMNMEILQLLHRDQALHKYLGQISFTAGDSALDGVENVDELVADLQKSDKASDFLKQRLLAPTEGSFTRSAGTVSVSSNFINLTINTAGGTIEIRTEGILASVKSVVTDQRVEGWEGGSCHSFEIEIHGSSGSRSTNPGLSIADTFEDQDMQSVLLLEKEVDGKPLMQWQIKGEDGRLSDLSTRGFSGNPGFIEKDQFFINLNTAGSDGLRGDGLKIGKLFVKIFSWIKPKRKKDNALDKYISEMGDSKYELLIYDLEGSTGKEWIRAEQIAGVFETINSDPKPLLVLMPGLLSKVEKGFDEFLANESVVTGLKLKFGRYVLGYNMPTLVRGIADNAREFSEMLADTALKQKKCSVIGRSSGGLISRYLFEEIWPSSAAGIPENDAPLVLQKLVVTGTANQGTLLASGENWANYVNIATNILSLLGSLTPVIPALMGIIKAIINKGLSLPGIGDLEEGSAVILKLNRIKTDRSAYFVVTSNFEPNGLLKRLFNERIIDRLIFKGEDNDTLAPVLGALFKNEDPSYQIVLADNQFHICSEQDEISHFAYLQKENEEVINKILGWI